VAGPPLLGVAARHPQATRGGCAPPLATGGGRAPPFCLSFFLFCFFFFKKKKLVYLFIFLIIYIFLFRWTRVTILLAKCCANVAFNRIY